MKDFAYATLTFSGVLSVQASLLLGVLLSPGRETITATHAMTPVRQASLHLPEYQPSEIPMEPVEAPTESEPPVIAEGDDDEESNDAPQNDENTLTQEPKAKSANAPSLAVSPTQKKAPKKKRRNRYRDCDDNDGFSSTDSGFAVQRTVVDYYANITRYRDLGHVSWYENDTGARTGFKLRRINCDLREAGIRNGDVVTSVNGQTVQTIPQAIKLWFKVRRKNRVVLQVIRRGKPITINYELI